jgi:RNA polymerase I-specific transcription initiation factor RRN7
MVIQIGLSHYTQMICRDLWTIHLNLLPSPPPPEPFFYAQESGKNTSDSSVNRQKKATVSLNTGRSEENRDENSEDSGSSSSSSVHDGEDDPEGEYTESISSSFEVGEGEPVSSVPLHVTGKRKIQTGRYEVLASTVVVLILACWTMRIPVIYMDFIK